MAPRRKTTATPKKAPAAKTDMRQFLRDKAELAQAFADDGAYHSAARVLLELAGTIKAHAIVTDAELQRYIGSKT